MNYREDGKRNYPSVYVQNNQDQGLISLIYTYVALAVYKMIYCIA